MATTALTPPTPSQVLPLWLNELQEADRATGTIRRYKSAVVGFFAWYQRCEQRPLTFALLTPITLVGYRNELQRTQGWATSTVKTPECLASLVRLADRRALSGDQSCQAHQIGGAAGGVIAGGPF